MGVGGRLMQVKLGLSWFEAGQYRTQAQDERQRQLSSIEVFNHQNKASKNKVLETARSKIQYTRRTGGETLNWEN